MPSDSMDDIELKNIQLQFPALRYLTRDDASVQEERIETDKGTVLVAIQGNRAKPAILTYHDLGLNCEYSSILFNIFLYFTFTFSQFFFFKNQTLIYFILFKIF